MPKSISFATLSLLFLLFVDAAHAGQDNTDAWLAKSNGAGADDFRKPSRVYLVDELGHFEWIGDRTVQDNRGRYTEALTIKNGWMNGYVVFDELRYGDFGSKVNAIRAFSAYSKSDYLKARRIRLEDFEAQTARNARGDITYVFATNRKSSCVAFFQKFGGQQSFVSQVNRIFDGVICKRAASTSEETLTWAVLEFVNRLRVDRGELDPQ